MNLFGLSGLLIGITSSSMAILVFIKNRENLANKLWILFTISVAIWGFGALKISITKDPKVALFYWRLVHIGVIFIPILFMHFVYTFLNKKEHWPIYFVYSIGFFFLFINFTDLFIKNVAFVFNSFYYDGHPPTIFYSVFTAFWFTVIIISHIILFIALRKSTGITKTQINYFIWGMLVSFSGGGMSFIPVFGVDIYPYGNLAGFLYPIIITYAILRYNLMDIHAVISKAVTYGSLAILSAAAAVPILISWEKYLFGQITEKLVELNWFVIITAFFMTLIATLFYPRIIARLQEKFRGIFFKEKYDFKKIVNELSNAVVNVLDLQSLLEIIAEQLTIAFDVSKVSIIALDQKRNLYKMLYSQGMDPALAKSFYAKPAGNFINALKETNKIVIKEEIERMLEEPLYQDVIKKYKEGQGSRVEGQEQEKEVARYQTPDTSNVGATFMTPNDTVRNAESDKSDSISDGVNAGAIHESSRKDGEVKDNSLRKNSGISEKEWQRLNYWFIAEKMKEIFAEISIPLFLHDKLVGVISMDMKGNKDAYSNEDLELLNTLSVQAAVAIQNAQFIEMDRQRFQMVRHMDKLASLGLLVSGVAHEIRNPLGTIKTFFQLFPERYDNEEFRTNFMKLASSEADRISRLVDEILGFAKTKRTDLVPGNINEFIDKIIVFVQMESKRKAVKFEKNLDNSIPKIMFDPERMRQVFLNFFMNGVEAMKRGGVLSVTTQKINMRGRDYIRIDIADTGEGISEENIGSLFTPFFTTKDDGTGLGLSISYQIINDHQGMIDVKSKINEGTTFYIYLPVEMVFSDKEKPEQKLPGLKRVLDNYNPGLSKV
ncbi:MAG: ATP-binding protein [bacterium]